MRMAAALAVGFLAVFASAAVAADPAQQEKNRKAVVEFYGKAINEKDFAAASTLSLREGGLE